MDPRTSAASALPTRRLGPHHLAFYRAHYEGLDLKQLGIRYLDTGADVVKAKRTLRWIRTELIAAARKQRPALVKVLSLTLEKLAWVEQGRAQLMTLEDFQAQRDPDGFYREAELIELFEQEVAQEDPKVRRKWQRNDRLRRKVREAVSWLEHWVASPPQLEHSVLAWLEESTGERLVTMEIETLDDLVRWIDKRGKHWHRKIPRLGPVQGARIEYFLKTLTLLPDHALPVPARPRVTTYESGIVPIDRLLLPTELSGATGRNRAYGTKLAAPDDLAAIHAWLASLGPRPATVRSYRKEAERFLLWVIFERGKALSSASTEDCISYRDFLDAIGQKEDGPQQRLWLWTLPQEHWIGARNTPRWSEDWRPFAGRLAISSQKLAVTILTALCEWLVRQRYLQTNPWDGVPPAHNFTPKIRADHSLTVPQWQTLIATADEMTHDEAYYRLRFVLRLAYGCGLRLSEMAAARIAPHTETPGVPHLGLQEVQGDWEVTVMGKGHKLRTVPVPISTMAALQDYMVARGFSDDTHTWPEREPLIASLGHGQQFVHATRQAVSASAVYELLRTHFKRTAVTTQVDGYSQLIAGQAKRG